MKTSLPVDWNIEKKRNIPHDGLYIGHSERGWEWLLLWKRSLPNEYWCYQKDFYRYHPRLCAYGLGSVSIVLACAFQFSSKSLSAVDVHIWNVTSSSKEIVEQIVNEYLLYKHQSMLSFRNVISLSKKVFPFFLRFSFYFFPFSKRTSCHLCMHHPYLWIGANDLEEKESPLIEVLGILVKESCERR